MKDLAHISTLRHNHHRARTGVGSALNAHRISHPLQRGSDRGENDTLTSLA